MRDRDAAKRKAIALSDPRDWAKYKKMRNTINNNIKTSKASYYSNAFSQSKGYSRITWQTIKNLLPVSPTIQRWKNRSWMVPSFLILVSFLMLLMTMYADDTQIIYADVDVNSIQLNLNNDLGNLNKWLTSNKLTLNTAKTEFMLTGSRQKLSTLSSQPELSINNLPIEKLSYLCKITWSIYWWKSTVANAHR